MSKKNGERQLTETSEFAEEFAEEKKEYWIHLVVVFGSTIVVSMVLDWLADGIPLGFVVPILNEPATVSMLIYHVAVFGGGAYVGYIGLRELIVERQFSVEFLMAVAAIVAALLDYLFEGATVLFLYSLAEYFEDYIEDRARRTVQKLSAYMPEEARVLEEDREKVINIKEIEPGATILIRPGERIPLDGTVAEGFSHVDQSVVTGESVPVLKKKGDTVYAGTLNGSSVLRVTVAKTAGETLVSRIVKLVMQSRKRKATMEKLVDRFARIYVPVVVAAAVFTALFMPSLTGGASKTWIYRSLILLVISCPSAFIISVPATIFTAITVAARRGVIIKGGIYVEKLAGIKSVVFDKTGTLTLGRLEVNHVELPAEGREQTLCYAAALEQYSNHPVAEAITRKASEDGLRFDHLKVDDIREIPGKGMTGTIDGMSLAIGNRELVKSCAPVTVIEADEISNSDMHTKVFVCVDGSLLGTICFSDRVRSDAIQAVRELRGHGIHTVMLTGDRREIAEDVAQRLGIDEVYAELLPEDKLTIVERLRSEYGPVAMVGDGINDAPALAISDVGIAMGGRGVDVALESADVVLVRDELARILYVHELGTMTVKVAKENIAMSLAAKFVLGALGFLGMIPLWFAVASGDDGLTMFTLLNTLRLTKVRTTSKRIASPSP